MKNRGFSNNAGMLSLFLSIALLAAVIGLAMAAAPREAAATTKTASTSGQVWYGMYTDKPSYEPGEAIQIHSSAPPTTTVFRLVRLDTAWTEITRTLPLTVTPQQSKVGSFIEYPTVSLSGRISFTLEGWLHPTLMGSSVPTDTVVVAGQIGLTESAAGIVILPDGRIAAYVSDTPPTDPTKLAIAEPISFTNWLDTWHHLALSYDGAQVKLYTDGVLAAQRDQTGAVADVTAPFRLGARSEAPGDLTGIIDGRLDNWTLWPSSLSVSQIKDRHDLGLTEVDPAPDLDVVDLYLNFEDPYPSIADSSSNGHVGRVINHGTPGVSGIITDTSRAFRLNHDQIVDAGWDVTAVITVPTGTESGMYAIQALTTPFTPTQTGPRLSVRTIAIRPPANGPRKPIAVVLPTNTWNAYTLWPKTYDPGTITSRSRYPGGPLIQGGNNSAYGEMGDGVSLAYFHGPRRPSNEASPVKTGAHIGGYSVRAPNSMYLTQWLDAQGFAYDVYSDNDFDMGAILASEYRVLMPHSHHEYWSDGMLDTMTQFLDDGGSVVAPAGNIFTWRIVYGANRVMEVRKFRLAPVLGMADLQSGIDWMFMGSPRDAALCNGDGSYHGGDRYKALGVLNHATKPCDDVWVGEPFCAGKWASRNTDHWLWQGSGLSEDERFGFGRETTDTLDRQTFAVGHEADTWTVGMPLPGLAAGQQPVILAEGKDFGPGNPPIRTLPVPDGYPVAEDPLDILPDGFPELPPKTCESSVLDWIGAEPAEGNLVQATTAGTILYFPHDAGGHVLVIGASATPWALESDAALSGLLQRGLNCFVYDQGCGYDIYLPAILRSS